MLHQLSDATPTLGCYTNFGMPPVVFQEGLTDPTMNENTLKNAGNLRLVGILCEVVTVVSAVEKEEILLKSVS